MNARELLVKQTAEAYSGNDEMSLKVSLADLTPLIRRAYADRTDE